MKLRLRDNALRLRLQQQEVEQLGRGVSIVAHTPLQNARLTYRLDAIEGPTVSASLEDACLAIGLPADQLRAWATSDQVAITAEIDTGQAAMLSVLVEKDFQCLAPDANRRTEDDADTFSHPGGARATE